MAEQKQLMPVHSVWKKIAQENDYSPEATIKIFFQDSKQLFLNDVKEYETENKYIPAKQKNIFRIMTFNVRMWTTLEDKSNFERAMNVIEKLNPDVLVLQEVTDWDKTYNHLVNELGFAKVAASCITKNPCFGPSIFVKNCIPLNVQGSVFKNQGNPDRQLSFVRIDLKINDTPVAIYGTHLEVDQLPTRATMEVVREKQLAEIFADAEKLSHANVIITGDFNSVQESDYQYKINQVTVWDLFQNIYVHLFYAPLRPSVLDSFKKKSYQSSFELLHWQAPRFTNWSGRVLDFIFFSPAWQFPITGSYVYYTDVSDHLPVMTDINI